MVKLKERIPLRWGHRTPDVNVGETHTHTHTHTPPGAVEEEGMQKMWWCQPQRGLEMPS